MKLLCLAVVQFVRCLVLSGHVVMSSEESGSGIPMVACGPPDVPSYEINTTEEQFNWLIVQGRCYTACITDLIVYEEPHVAVNSTYPSWPFAVETGTTKCEDYVNELHECIRGCTIYYRDPRAVCGIQCRTERCPSIEHDTHFLWRSDRKCEANSSCQMALCQLGCTNGHYYTNNNDYCYAIIPQIQQLDIRSERRGLFSIRLPNGISKPNCLFGFLFKVEDVLSKNVTYIWKHDPRELLNLTGYGCRTVYIFLSLVHVFGHTSFTGPLEVYVDGDEVQIPYGPGDIFFSEEIHSTLFRHVILSLNWEHPQNDTFLMGYLLQLVPMSNCNSSMVNLELEIPYNSSSRMVTAVINAVNERELVFMGCSYTITISSIGKHGNTPASSILYQARSLDEFMTSIVPTFTCEKSISVYYDLTLEPYFKFTLSWFLAFYKDYVEKFVIDYNIYSKETLMISDSVEDRNSSTHPAHIDSFSTQYMRYSHPRRNMEKSFLFKISIKWNQSNIFSTNPMSCMLSALSPAPSEVRDIVMGSAQALSDRDISVNASWREPLTLNGVLAYYTICLTSAPIQETLSSSVQSACTNISSEYRSVQARVTFASAYTAKNVYFQIRAANTYVSGNWSESISIVITPRPAKPFPVVEVSVPVVIIVVVAAALVAMIILCWARRRRNYFKPFTEDSVINALVMTPRHGTTLINFREHEQEHSGDDWELLPQQVVVGEELGKGAFGVVRTGSVEGPLLNQKVKVPFRNAVHITVAIKMLNDGATGSEKKDFLAEIEMMKKISEGHNPHVVAMLGCVTIQEPLCLVLEFVQLGNLLNYLRNVTNPVKMDKRISTTVAPSMWDTFNFSYQIADGMEFLSSKGVLHRDLACRNILVGEDKVLKITDFGLSRETEKYMKTGHSRVPFKWMPLEFLQTGEFTFASDVWSYGIVLWEIATFGGEPYSGVRYQDLVDYLKEGHRLQKPEEISEEFYDVMKSCWQEEPSKRPKFSHLKEKFSEMLMSQRAGNEYVFLQNAPETGEKSCLNVQKSDDPSLTRSKHVSCHWPVESSDCDNPGRPKSLLVLQNTGPLSFKVTDPPASRGSTDVK